MLRDERWAHAMRDVLAAGANGDGGWGYYPGHASRLEATCWALLALEATDSGSAERVPSHRRFLLEAQLGDGLLLEPTLRDENRTNLAFNGLAALLLNAVPQLADDSVRHRLLNGLLSHKGEKFAQSPLSPQDNSLQGWAWIDSTFSWVEPTCWCVIALKKIAPREPRARARIEEAERLLRDRCCAAGGWNAGTASVMGQGLAPFVPTTALGLLALQDLPSDAVVVKSGARLRQDGLSERSAMALSLTLLASDIAGIEAGDVEEALLAQWHRTQFLGNIHLTAMALYSLTRGEHGAAAFKV